MNFRALKLKLPLLFGLATVTLVFPATAQKTGLPPSQSIIFSTPTGSQGSSITPSLSPENSDQFDLANQFQAPSSANRSSGGDASGPPPAPTIISSSQNNWMFMTPAQILGTPTPAQILGVSGSDISGQKKNQSAFNQSSSGPTNSYQNNYVSGGNNNQSGGNNIFGSSGNSSDQIFNHFLNSPPDKKSENAQSGGDWGHIFGMDQQTPTSVGIEQPALDRIQQLLQPTPPPVASTTPTYNDNTTFSTPNANNNNGKANILSGSSQLTANSINSTPWLLNDTISKTPSLPTVPSFNQQKALPSLPTPSWVPEPAPWLSQLPQPFQIPQRKF